MQSVYAVESVLRMTYNLKVTSMLHVTFEVTVQVAHSQREHSEELDESHADFD